MADAELSKQHLADLHELAAELEIPRYRLLRRDQLVEAIEEARREEPPAPKPEEAPGEPGAGEEPGAEPPPEPSAPGAEEVVVEGALVGAEDEGAVEVDEAGPRGRDAEEPTDEIAGVLDLMPQRFGFLRLQGLEPHPDDVYISASQVRRCELRAGDTVSGPAREPRRGERHRALVHVDRVNDEEPLASERPDFDALPPVLPERRLALDGERGDTLTRAVDLLAPLALGQRVLVRSAPRSGRTTLLRGLARAVESADDVGLIVLLIDERPEEATAWREAISEAELAIATADLAPQDQQGVAELALERARRRVEAGEQVVLIVDSLSRLAQASGGAAAVKRLFGSGRNLAGGGSLTVIATVLAGGADEGEAERAVATTESSTIALDPDLAAAGIVPALRAAECRVSNEEELRDADELGAVRSLRSELIDLAPAEAANLLRERIEASSSNAELLRSL